MGVFEGLEPAIARLGNAKAVMLARFEHVVWMYRLLLVGTVATCAAVATGGQALDGVAEIHFGIIEPPVVAQQDITICTPVSAQATEEKPLECSGMAWANGRLIVASDRHGLALFSCPVDVERMTIGVPVPQTVIGNEQELLDDAECLVIRRDARREWVVYVMCSLSNDPDELPLPKRRHMLRLALRDLDPARVARPAVISGGVVRDEINERFEAVGIEPYRCLLYTSDAADE